MNKSSFESGSILSSLLISLTLQQTPDSWSAREHTNKHWGALCDEDIPLLASGVKTESFAGDPCASSAPLKPLKLCFLQDLAFLLKRWAVLRHAQDLNCSSTQNCVSPPNKERSTDSSQKHLGKSRTTAWVLTNWRLFFGAAGSGWSPLISEGMLAWAGATTSYLHICLEASSVNGSNATNNSIHSSE